MNQDIKIISQLNKNWQPGKLKIKKAGGQTNRNWVVQYKKKKFFVRVPWERADIIDRKIEARNIFALSRNRKVKKILPEYYLYAYQGKNILKPKSREVFDVPDGTMITEYIPGRLFTLSLFRKRKYQEKLAEMFYIFHTGGVRFVNEYNVFRDEIEKYRLAAKKYPIQKLVNVKIIKNFERIEKEAGKIIPFSKKGVSTHNDFIFQNFLVGRKNKIYLLDFEYAGLNQKGGILYDFGFLFADNFFRNPSITQELFERFLEVADKIYKQSLNRELIYWSATAATLVMFWWGLIRYFSVEAKIEKNYFKDYILKRAQGIRFLCGKVRGLKLK